MYSLLIHKIKEVTTYKCALYVFTLQVWTVAITYAHTYVCTQHPPLSTLYSAPTTKYPPLSTLYSTPSTQHPLLDTLHSAPSTRHPPLTGRSHQVLPLSPSPTESVLPQPNMNVTLTNYTYTIAVATNTAGSKKTYVYT